MKESKFYIFRSRHKKHFPPFPSSLCVDYLSSALSVKRYGRRFKKNIYAYDEEKLYAIIGYESDYKKFGKYFLKRFLGEPEYLDKLVKWSERNKNSLKEYLEKNFNTEKTKKYSNKQIWEKLSGFVKKYRHFHLVNTPAWWLGVDPTEAELKRSLLRFKNADEIFSGIINPSEFKTENLLEEISSIKIAVKANKLGCKKLTSKSLKPEIKKCSISILKIFLIFRTVIIQERFGMNLILSLR